MESRSVYSCHLATDLRDVSCQPSVRVQRSRDSSAGLPECVRPLDATQGPCVAAAAAPLALKWRDCNRPDRWHRPSDGGPRGRQITQVERAWPEAEERRKGRERGGGKGEAGQPQPV